MPLIIVVRRLRQEDGGIEHILDYILSPYFQTRGKKEKREKKKE